MDKYEDLLRQLRNELFQLVTISFDANDVTGNWIIDSHNQEELSARKRNVLEILEEIKDLVEEE
jgi:hypothetical protein